MNPTTPNKAVRIGPESQPVFPCWLWIPESESVADAYWYRLLPENADADRRRWSQPTHWHPDQPEAPTFAPEEEGVPCIDRLSAGFHAAVERDRLAGTSSPDWVMEAAKKLLVVTNIPEHERENLIAVNANIIRQHAPKRAPSVPAVEGVREAEAIAKEWLAGRACCNGEDCACHGITRLEQMVGEELAHRTAKAVDLNRTRDGVGHETTYQPQHKWNDGEFEDWTNLGMRTMSKRNAVARMVMFREINPGVATRYLKISSVIEVCDLDAALRSSNRTGEGRG